MNEVCHVRIRNYNIAYEITPCKSAKGSIVMVHGMGEHCWRYTHVVKFFVEKCHLNVLRFDLPGHGLTSGKRGHISEYEDFLAPIDHFLNEFRKKNLPVFLFGHSMGGNIVLGYLLKKQPKLQGAIIASPWVALSFKPGFIKMVFARIINKIFPSYSNKNDLTVYALSRDEQVLEAYADDDMVHDWVSARLFVETSAVATQILMQADKITQDCLMYHGKDDQITAHWATKKIAKKMKHTQFISYESGYHEMHNEPNKTIVFDNIEAFIKKRLKN